MFSWISDHHCLVVTQKQLTKSPNCQCLLGFSTENGCFFWLVYQCSRIFGLTYLQLAWDCQLTSSRILDMIWCDARKVTHWYCGKWLCEVLHFPKFPRRGMRWLLYIIVSYCGSFPHSLRWAPVSNVGKTTINHPFGNGFNPTYKNGGLRDGLIIHVYSCFTHIYKDFPHFFQLSVAGPGHRSGEGPQADSTHRSSWDAKWYTWFMDVDSQSQW